MGDRANVVIREPNYRGDRNAPDVGSHEAVFLYGHWSGYDLPEQLRTALITGRERWNDAAYLARICFDQMVGESQGATTGYGLSTRLTDNEYDLLVLLPAEQRLVRLPEDAYRANGFDLEGHPSISFEDYVTADERTWDNLTEVMQRA